MSAPLADPLRLLERMVMMESPSFDKNLVDTETATEPCTVLREAIFYVCTQSAQLPTQLRNIGTEVREIARDRQIALSANEESGWLPLGLLHPEDLRKGDRLVVACVVEDAQNDGVAVVVSQRYGPGRTGHFVAFGLIVAEHIGT